MQFVATYHHIHQPSGVGALRPRNIIILYVATSITGGQPRNFFAHLEIVVKELVAASVGFKIGVCGVPTTVHLVVPVVSCDGPGPPPLTHPPL